jgi:site-specific DNA recombinase
MPRKADPAPLKAAARVRHWFEEIASGRVRSAEVARREGLQKGNVGRLTRLAFLSPSRVEG